MQPLEGAGSRHGAGAATVDNDASNNRAAPNPRQQQASQTATQTVNSPRAVAQTGHDSQPSSGGVEFNHSGVVGLAVLDASAGGPPGMGVLYARGSISSGDSGLQASGTLGVASSGRVHAPLVGNWGIGLMADAGCVSAELGMRFNSSQPSPMNSGVAAGFEASAISGGAGISYDGQRFSASLIVGGAVGVGGTVRAMAGNFRVAVKCGVFVDFSLSFK